MQPAVGIQNQELLAAGAAAVEDESDLVAIRTLVERRRRLPPEPNVDLVGVQTVVVDGRRRGALHHVGRIHEVIHERRREGRRGIEHALGPAARRTRRRVLDDLPAAAARDRNVTEVGAT